MDTAIVQERPSGLRTRSSETPDGRTVGGLLDGMRGVYGVTVKVVIVKMPVPPRRAMPLA